MVRPCDCDAHLLAEQVRQVLALAVGGTPPRVRHRRLPDGIACAVACQDGELVILVDDGKPLADDHAMQLLAEVTEVMVPAELPEKTDLGLTGL